MSIGSSGRIVIEVLPEAKRELYATLARDGLTLKDWFVRQAHSYVAHSAQTVLRFESEELLDPSNADQALSR